MKKITTVGLALAAIVGLTLSPLQYQASATMEDKMVRLIAKLDKTLMEHKMMEKDAKVLEGWLVDTQSGYKLSIGQLNVSTLVFTQRMVNPWIYDVIVITEEPIDDTDPSPHMPVGGAQLGEPFGK